MEVMNLNPDRYSPPPAEPDSFVEIVHFAVLYCAFVFSGRACISVESAVHSFTLHTSD